MHSATITQFLPQICNILECLNLVACHVPFFLWPMFSICKRSADVFGQLRTETRQFEKMQAVWSLALSCWKWPQNDVPGRVMETCAGYHQHLFELLKSYAECLGASCCLARYKIPPGAMCLCKTNVDLNCSALTRYTRI